MKKNSILLTSTILSTMLFTGCSFSNPFGIGHEKSACEVSSGFGVCGAPKKIYLNRDKIKKVQNDYMQSGYEDTLFFGINNIGEILIKEERDDNWQLYKTSDIKKEIDLLLSQKKALKITTENSMYNENNHSHDININGVITENKQDIPVTVENDLSIKYTKQKPLIETRTNVGAIVRDTGLIQKIWIAPVVDAKKDLISAHEIYLVVKEPSWTVGEATPKHVKTNQLGTIPTPISQHVLHKTEHYNEHEEKVITHFNNGNTGGLLEEIENNPNKEFIENKEDLNIIKNFIEE